MTELRVEMNIYLCYNLVKRGENMFNLIADIIEYLLNNNTTRILENYSCVSPDYIDECSLTTVYELLLDPVKQFNNHDVVNIEYIKKIRIYYESLVLSKDNCAIVHLLETLDHMVQDYCESLKMIDEYDVIEFEKLNTKITRVELYPKCLCSWEHKNMGKAFRYDIRDHLKNLYFIDLNDIPRNFLVKNYFVNNKLFLSARYRDELRIGISPLTNENVFPLEMIEFSNVENINTFSINGVSASKMLLNNVDSIINTAIRKEVDFLVFPEMLGTKEINELISRYVDRVDIKTPPIIVSPSLWTNHSNVSTLFFGSDSSDVIDQPKNYKFPFEYQGNSYIEDLNFREGNIINLFHCDGIGVFSIVICKDLLIKEYLDFLIEKLKITLIISPSFSTGEYPFEVTVPQGYQYDCDIIWINSCAAKHLKDDEKPFSDTIGLGTHNGTITRYNLSEQCKKNCSKCIFVHSFKLGGRV